MNTSEHGACPAVWSHDGRQLSALAVHLLGDLTSPLTCLPELVSQSFLMVPAECAPSCPRPHCHTADGAQFTGDGTRGPLGAYVRQVWSVKRVKQRTNSADTACVVCLSQACPRRGVTANVRVGPGGARAALRAECSSPGGRCRAGLPTPWLGLAGQPSYRGWATAYYSVLQPPGTTAALCYPTWGGTARDRARPPGL